MSRRSSSRERWASRALATRLAVVAALTLAHGAGAAAATAAPDGPWSAAPSLFHSRAAHAVVSTGEALIALGGTGAQGRPVLEVERFDGTRWRAEGRLPGNGLNAPAAAVIGRRLYLIGGFDMATNVPTDRVSVYDLDRRKPRGTAGAVAYCGAIHLFGGESQALGKSLASVLRLDPASAQWQALQPMPTARSFARAAQLGASVYVVGGDPDAGNSHGGAGSAIVERYSRQCAS